ncbi:MAG: hypothetical protein K0S58_3504 [Nitrospira sp.]|jgi:hypothetical protein|nr:hypothetical protein [Nitrospira sp.]
MMGTNGLLILSGIVEGLLGGMDGGMKREAKINAFGPTDRRGGVNLLALRRTSVMLKKEEASSTCKYGSASD